MACWVKPLSGLLKLGGWVSELCWVGLAAWGIRVGERAESWWEKGSMGAGWWGCWLRVVDSSGIGRRGRSGW